MLLKTSSNDIPPLVDVKVIKLRIPLLLAIAKSIV